MDQSRLLVFSPQGEVVCEVSGNDLWKCDDYEEVNGQHYIELITTHVLKKEQRILTIDETSKVREYVVSTEDARHKDGDRPYGTYKCPWSLQHDMTVCTVSRMPGVQNPVSASTALEAALSGTSRWTVGNVTQLTYGGASMYQTSGWNALSILVGEWGGEIDADIEVEGNRVVARRVNLLHRMGQQVARRRFDYSRDLTGVTREVGSDPVACRIIPRGKGEQIGDGYGRKITIEDVNDGIEYLRNPEAEELFGLPDGNGGYEYPTVYVDNPAIEDPQELKDWGLSVLNSYTTPDVTYRMDVVQVDAAGSGEHGVGLGDAVQCVDLEFGDVPLRVEARVMSIKRDRLKGETATVTIGNVTASKGLGSTMSNALRSIETLDRRMISTSEYLDNLIENVNHQINATGGYWYAVRGQGTRTYDAEVSDPLVGAEASKVIEMRGGSMRIADSRTDQGEWDWRSVFESGRIATEMVVGGQIITGYIGNPEGNVYINLDTGVVNIGPSAMVGATSLEDALSDARRYATDYLHYESGELTLGLTDSAVRNVITATKQAYRTDAGDIAWYGLDEAESIWKLFIDNAQVNDTLRFGDFAWIARANGNMTVKWVGD